MPDRAVVEHRDVGGAATHVDETDTEFLFVVQQHRLARCELFEDDVIDLQSAVAHALGDVLRRAGRSGHHVDLRFEAHARHPGRFSNPFLAIDDVLLRKGVENLLIGRDRNRPRGVDDPGHVARRHFLVPDRHHPVGVETANVAARDAGEHGVNLASRHQLRLFHRAPNRLHGGFDVHHHSFLQPARRDGCPSRSPRSPLPSTISPTIADTFEVPMSRPTMRFFSERFMADFSPPAPIRPHADRETGGVAEIDAFDLANPARRLPSRASLARRPRGIAAPAHVGTHHETRPLVAASRTTPPVE